MSFMRNYYPQGASYHDSHWSSFDRSNFSNNSNTSRYWNDNYYRNPNNFRTYADQFKEHFNYPNNVQHNNGPSLKRRKFSASSWGDSSRYNLPPSDAYYDAAPSTNSSSVPPAVRSDMDPSTSTSCKRVRSKLEEEEQVLLSRDEIERCSPSRKDGIDAVKEAHLRYSYCAFIQNLGLRLELPQTTTGTAMVLCHRFFVRRSHACHDRFLIATAALFLAAKSEETPRPLNNVLRASSEILHTQDITFLSYILPVDWFEQYRERVLQAEHMILTTLNFELNVEHPYDPLTSVLNKLGLSQTVLVNMALNLVSEGGCTRLASRLYDIVSWWIDMLSMETIMQRFLEYILPGMVLFSGLRSSLWLQFKPHHIAAGAAYLAAKFLNLDLASYQNVWQEFGTTPDILHDVAQQLMELLQYGNGLTPL